VTYPLAIDATGWRRRSTLSAAAVKACRMADTSLHRRQPEDNLGTEGACSCADSKAEPVADCSARQDSSGHALKTMVGAEERKLASMWNGDVDFTWFPRRHRARGHAQLGDREVLWLGSDHGQD
jgi:hypothetical protein